MVDYCKGLVDGHPDYNECGYALIGLTRHGTSGALDAEDLKLCTACPGNPPDERGWSTKHHAGCSMLDEWTCPWGAVCNEGGHHKYGVRNGCIKRPFGYGIEPFIAFEGCSALNQQWIVRGGVVGGATNE